MNWHKHRIYGVVLALLVLLACCSGTIAAASGPEMSYQTYLPLAEKADVEVVLPAACVHPRYNELPEHVGELACYEQVYVEKVYVVTTSEGTECAFIASVFVLQGYDGEAFYNDWWAGAVWVNDPACLSAGLQVGTETSLKATVLGTHAMAGQTYEEGITIPLLKIE